MGLFGDYDASEVSDNPFYVAPDIYMSVLSDLTLRDSKDGEKKGLSFQWTIEEEGDYQNNNVSEWINVYLDADAEAAADAAAVRRDRARLKARLTQIGMSEAEMNEFIDEDGHINEDIQKNYIGTVAYVTIVETKDKNDDTKVYTNIKEIKLPGDE